MKHTFKLKVLSSAALGVITGVGFTSFLMMALSAQSYAAAASSAVPLIFGKAVPKAQADLFLGDIARLKTQSFSKADPSMLSIMQIANTNAATLDSWLAARIHYVVDENFDLKKAAVVVAPNYVYDNPTVAPDAYLKSPVDNDDSAGAELMANIGAGVYIAGKINATLLGLNLDGKVIPMTSPRVGILQIGSGMSQLFQDNAKEGITDRTASISRLSILFHEARHSDGNGRFVGFSHSICPPDHNYAGLAACDDYVNGAYIVGGLTLRAMTESCTDCSKTELLLLRSEYLDDFSRMVASAPSDSTESEIESLLPLEQSCQGMAKIGLAHQGNCDQVLAQMALLQDPKNLMAATTADPTPEGHR